MSNEQNEPKSNKPMGMWIGIGVAIGAAPGMEIPLGVALGQRR